MTDSEELSIASRKAALTSLRAVLCEGQSLSGLAHISSHLPPRDAAFAQFLSYGVLRFYFQLKAQLNKLLQKPLKSKDIDIERVLLLALYQLQHTRVPDYAVVDVAVRLVPRKKAWAKKLVNGVLRNFLRQRESLQVLNDEQSKFNHPHWIIDQLKQDWPEDWQGILEGNNQQPPMTLRVNRQKVTTRQYLDSLLEQGITAEAMSLPDAIQLAEPAEVGSLPGYAEGWFSVQDAGAQLAAQILSPQPGDQVLDACAAPGGKTAHLLEREPDIRLTALDISESRLQRVSENCQRLGHQATLIAADVADLDSWWKGELYDRILLDVPCSATGVIRRHPDIKHLRRPDDIPQLVNTQRQILQQGWSILKPGGFMLYATCSVFSQENQQQIEWFLSAHPDARVESLDEISKSCPAGENLKISPIGLQLLPLNPVNDGFYYALLRKMPD